MQAREFRFQEHSDLAEIASVLRKLARDLREMQTVSGKAGFDPNQPRVPSGNSDGGQWTSTGEISGTHIQNNFNDAAIIEPGLGHPPVIEMIAGLTVLGGRMAVRIAAGLTDAVGASIRIRKAAKSIEEYLGGRGIFKRNKADDMYVIRGDKKIRFDINNSHGEKPHFHIENGVHNGRKVEWEDAGSDHFHEFRSKE